MKVQNMMSSRGNIVANQFEIFDSGIRYFQSYNSIICRQIRQNKIELDEYYWDYSRTTGKYRNIFLNETKKETEKKIKEGIYILTNLN